MGERRRDLFILRVAVSRRKRYIGARRQMAGENIRIVSRRAHVRVVKTSDRVRERERDGDVEMPEGAEITDKTSEYFTRQTSEHNVGKKDSKEVPATANWIRKRKETRLAKSTRSIVTPGTLFFFLFDRYKLSLFAC